MNYYRQSACNVTTICDDGIPAEDYVLHVAKLDVYFEVTNTHLIIYLSYLNL